MKRKKDFPDYWRANQRNRGKIPVTSVVSVFKRDTKTDSDFDGVPNYRDCVWYDPRKQGLKDYLEFRIEERKVLQEMRKKERQEKKQLKKEGLWYFKRLERRLDEQMKSDAEWEKIEKEKEELVKKQTARLSPQDRHNLYYCKFCKKTFPKKVMDEDIYCPYCGDDVGVVKVRAYTRDELPGRPDTERGVPYYKKSRRR